MKKIPWRKITDNPRYPSHLSTVVLAMFVANLHILYQGSCLYIAALTPQAYFVAVLVNMCFGFVLIQLIIRSTAYLDIHFPWNNRYQKRMKWQILLGFFAPVLLITLLMILYCVLQGTKIKGNCYFKRYLHQIILMSLVLNFYLFAHRNRSNKREIGVTKKNLQPIRELAPELYQDIACIYIEEKNYFSINFKGEKMGWNHTLSESMAFLPSSDFYPIKHSFIVNRSAILEMKIISAKKTKILLKVPINMEIEISQRVNVAFKRWYAIKKA